MTNRWYEGGVTKLIQDDIKAHEKASENSENLR